MGDGLIRTEENEDLFGSPPPPEPKKEEKDDFAPPPLLTDEKTPVIKFMTPVRRKRRDFTEPPLDDEDDDFPAPDPNSFVPVRTPQLDLSDDDDVNEHVKRLVSFPGEQNYDNEPEKIQELCEEMFRLKYQSLAANYAPKFKIEYPEGKSLNKVHKYYHEWIKTIYVNFNISQYETYYMLTLLVIEFVGVQVFGLPMSGYTESEMERRYRYRSLMIELGESFYPDGTGEPASIEWRVFSSVAWNIIIFLAVKIIANWVGGEEMVDWVREVIDQLLDNPISKDNIESGEANDIDAGNAAKISNLLGGDGGGMADIVTGIGTMFTKNIEGKQRKRKDRKRERVVYGN